jgi:chorismate-pyruvate lyase
MTEPHSNTSLEETLHWQSDLKRLSNCPDRLHSWLSETGLLTTRLAHLAKRKLRVEVINQEACLLDRELASGFTSKSRNAIARRVRLKDDNEDWVIAETLIPVELWQSTQWLNQLGTQPLGEALVKTGVTELSEFEFVEVQAQSRLGRLACMRPEQSLFARRRWHQIKDSRILIQEIFMPALTLKILQ